MRRTLSLIFAILILFNTVGYMYVLNWSEGELERKAEELIDEHISEISGNLIFTIPVTTTVPGDNEYHRIDGEFQFEGTLYRMVKQRVEGNMRYVVCVKDQETQIASEEINNVIAAVAGQPVKESGSSAMKALGSLLKYCDTSLATESSSANGWSREYVFTYPEDTYSFTSVRALFHPPSLS
ncbi:MAG: hypothetical protein WDO14_19000 [Bacteroidota bacterium]